MAKKKKIIIVVKPAKVRDPFAIHAKQRKAGPMKNKNKGRGGNRNVQRDLLEDQDKEE